MIRKAKIADIEQIMEIIHDAQSLLSSLGVDQWQDGYPTAEIIHSDINNGECFVVVEEGQIVGSGIISFAGEPTYKIIEGEWMNSAHYAVIHRLAVRKSARGKGYAKYFFDYAELLCQQEGLHNIRVDTHADNKIMQTLLNCLGYTSCGTITLTSGAKRIAFQKEW